MDRGDTPKRSVSLPVIQFATIKLRHYQNAIDSLVPEALAGRPISDRWRDGATAAQSCKKSFARTRVETTNAINRKRGDQAVLDRLDGTPTAFDFDPSS
jgi:hypothetical protein